MLLQFCEPSHFHNQPIPFLTTCFFFGRLSLIPSIHSFQLDPHRTLCRLKLVQQHNVPYLTIKTVKRDDPSRESTAS
jgi:hypothetical protein